MFSIQCRSSLSAAALDGSPPGATIPQNRALCGVLGEPNCEYVATYSAGDDGEPVVTPLPLGFAAPSESEVAPTAMTPVSHAGVPTAPGPLLPEAATTMTPAAIAFATAAPSVASES